MPIDFPSSPASGQTYAYNSITWSWNGSAWEKIVYGLRGVTGPTGDTGPVGDYVSYWNGQTGAVTFSNYVSSFGGRTGTVGAGVTSTQILYWSNNDVTGSNNFTFDGTDIVTLAETGYYSGRLLGPVLLPIKNTGLTLINIGDPVYAVGSVGNSGVVEVFRADAAESSKMPAIGLADSSLAHNATGHAVVFGNLKLVDTSAYTINGTVYVAPGGGITGIKPTGADNLIQNIGRVVRVNQSTGDILVSAIGRSNDVPNIVQVRSWLQMPDGMTATGLVKSFNGLTGAVTGVTTSTSNRFTAIQIFAAGLTASGITTPNVYPSSTGTLILGVPSSSTNITVNDSQETVSILAGYQLLLQAPTSVTEAFSVGTDQTVAVPFTVNTNTTGSQNAVEIVDQSSNVLAGITPKGIGFFNRGLTGSGLTLIGNGLVTGSFEVDGTLILGSGQGITGAVTSFNGLTGAVSGVTAINAGTGISITGTTNPTITNTGVTGFNGATGNVTGVTGIAAGTGISISGTTRPTITNTGVQTWNGLTGAVTGVTTSVANTFTAPQTFARGITLTTPDVNTVPLLIYGDTASITDTIQIYDESNNLGLSYKPTVGLVVNSSILGTQLNSSGSIQFGSPFVCSLDTERTPLTTTAANQTISTTQVIVDAAPIFRTIEFTVQASTTTAYETLKITVIHDNTNTYNTQYGVVRSGGSLGTYTTTLSGDNLLLRVTPTTANTTYTVVKKILEV